MNLVELITLLKEKFNNIALVHSVFDGVVYDNWNSTEIKYGSVNIGVRNITYNQQSITYDLVIYYGDRLLQNTSNMNQIFTDGVNVIQSVINDLDDYHIDITEEVVYTPFDQKFADYLAGVYATIQITTESTIGVCNNLMYEDDEPSPLDDYKGLVFTSLVDDNYI